MKKIGEILKEERLKRKLTLEQASQATRIRQPVLSAIEESRYNQLPSSIYTRGLISNYASFLDLDQEKILAFFRREYGRPETAPSPQTSLPPQPAKSSSFTFSSTYFLYLLVGLVFTLSALFLGRQYLRYGRQPQIIVTQPQNNALLTRPALTVSGRTEPENSVSINGQPVQVDDSGFFNLNLFLEPGLQKIEVIAKNPQGKKAVVERIVKVENPPEG